MKNKRALASFLIVIGVATVTYAHDEEDHEFEPDGGNVTILPETCLDVAQCGRTGPEIPMHVTSVHASLLWNDTDETPKMLLFQRHSGYSADDHTNPDVLNYLIQNPSPATFSQGNTTIHEEGKTALDSRFNQFNSAVRQSFQQLVYGGYNIIQDISQAVPTRIAHDQTVEMSLLWDLGHPDAFRNAGKFFNVDLNNSDGELNEAAFKNAGYSTGLHADLYCVAFNTLPDGRVMFPGGHDMNSRNGLYKIQIYDPRIERWAPRTESCIVSNWKQRHAGLNGFAPDPYSERFYREAVAAAMARPPALAADATPQQIQNRILTDVYYPGCNPHDQSGFVNSPIYPLIPLAGPQGTITQPRDRSDMKYARWYPTSITLPDGKVLIIAGVDKDERTLPTVTDNQLRTANTQAMTPFIDFFNLNPGSTLFPPLPVNYDLTGFQYSTSFSGSDLTIVTPEVYDPVTDTTVALEQSRMGFHGWYPNAVVVQTGPDVDDWKVAVVSAERYDVVQAMLGREDAYRAAPGMGQFSKTWLFDVQAALADPEAVRNAPPASFADEARHWTFVDQTFAVNPNTGLITAVSQAPYNASAYLVEVDSEGLPTSQKLIGFGGTFQSGGGNSATVQMIDFSSPTPEYIEQQSLYQRVRMNYATPLPDGTVLIGGGTGGGGQTRETIHSLIFQQFNPATGTTRQLSKSFVPRGEHGTIMLLPDATVLLAGQNRNDLVQAGDVRAPNGDADLGVPNGQIFSPPYLFKKDGSGQLAPRPGIVVAPNSIKYGGSFKVEVTAGHDIQSVVLIRPGTMSHSMNTDLRYVKVPFTKNSGAAAPSSAPGHGLVNKLTVKAPKLPGTAVAGNYMLFVVDSNGVPSVGKRVKLQLD
jgi:hypothetical protein